MSDLDADLDAVQMALSPSQMELVQLGDLRFLRPSLELKHLYTIIRNHETSRSDFIFYSDRIIRLLIEEALTLVPFERRVVITPTGEKYEGLRFSNKIAGVWIVRAGESMEKGLREVVRNIRIGKILIQRDEATAAPKLFYSKLPADIATRFVFLLDPMLATGGSANKAIDVLLEHGVEESKIYFVNMISCPEGIRALHEAHPLVTIITGEMDPSLNEKKFILPGVGDFGDRYFGTV